MKDELIKLAEEAGFEEAVYVDTMREAPDLIYYLWMCELQKWLRGEFHKLRVFVTQSVQGIYSYEIRKWNYDNQIGKWQRISYPISYETYELALEAGLIEAFKIKKEDKTN